MFAHPDLTSAIAAEHRRDLLAQSDARALARTARASAHGPRTGQRQHQLPRRVALIVRRLVTAAEGTAAA